MKLSVADILNCIQVDTHMQGNEILFSEVYFDSRKSVENAVFVAIRGSQLDGHEFIQDAISNGARMIVCEEFPQTINPEVHYVKVKSASYALGKLASAFEGNPSEDLKLVGVTGTNGKTTIASLLYRLMENLGYKSGLLSTVRNLVHQLEIPSTHTTPDPIQINRLMRQMVDSGCEYCFMEVSSHAVDQNRIAGLSFDGAVFTNLSHDHLDYHKNFQAYLSAKKRFFDELPSSAFALVNTDDKNAAVMVQNCKAKKRSYSLTSMSDFRAKVEEKHFDGMQMFFDGTEAWTSLIGMYNASNLLAVYSVAILLEMDKDEILPALSQLKSVEGRMETIRSNSGVTAIVDYAHTPDALQNVLMTLNELKSGGETIITVVGAGGNRDSSKRPEMAKIASLWSNKVVLTSDNPRFEDPESILDDMEKGVPMEKATNVLRVTNRKEAIKVACSLAKSGDLVFVAGKGHETYQEINGIKQFFDDREIIRELFKL
jgi:UDP-N-acetylmuramoyl-L-alanyl-D-glutamate--2,6-diaminopimelate ligase